MEAWGVYTMMVAESIFVTYRTEASIWGIENDYFNDNSSQARQ